MIYFEVFFCKNIPNIGSYIVITALNIAQEELAEQDKKYLPLMAEREAEYAQEMKTKMDNFVKEHAAKILQTAWRQVLANRKEKKKVI